METAKHSIESYTVSGSKARLPVQVAVNSLLTVSALRGIPGCYDYSPWVATVFTGHMSHHARGFFPNYRLYFASTPGKNSTTISIT